MTFLPPTPDATRGLVCHAGHDGHATRRVTVALRGQGVVHEYPAIPERLAMDITLDVYEWDQYGGFRGYCTGQDESSHALALGQVWEGYETLLALGILDGGDRHSFVLDFGANLGWYTCIAGKMGYPVVAFEADREKADRCRANAELNGTEMLDVVWTWIDETSPRFAGGGEPPHVRLLKSDTEGMEHEVVRVCGDLFAQGLIDFALIEMSPVFIRANRGPGWGAVGGYSGLAEWICAQGYEAFDVPQKSASAELKALFEADPLVAIKACRVETRDLRVHLGAIDQTTFLFARRGVL